MGETSTQSVHALRAYRAVLNATGLVGGTSLLVIVFGMVKTKTVATVLGPAGTGAMALYTAIVVFVTSVTSLGIGPAGVREIAAAAASEGPEPSGPEFQSAVQLVRAASVAAGLLGSLVQLVAARQLSTWMFDTGEHATAIQALAVLPFLQAVNAGQQAILQGARKLTILAGQSLIAALAGTLASVGLVLQLGPRGLLPLLLVPPALGTLTSWAFTRRIGKNRSPLEWQELGRRGTRLLWVGFSLSIAALSTSTTAFIVATYTARSFGVAGAGLYQAAWALSGVMVGFVLTAMTTDYYPRLVALRSDRAALSDAVQRQAEIALLMGVPVLALTTVAAQPALTILYSGQYTPATALLRWLVGGMFLRLLIWPLAYTLVAEGRTLWFLLLELAGNAAQVVAVFALGATFGLLGVAVAFPVLYLFYGALVILVVRRVTHIKLDAIHFLRAGLAGTALIGIALSAAVGTPVALTASWAGTLGVCVACGARLVKQAGVPGSELPARLRARLRLAVRNRQ